MPNADQVEQFVRLFSAHQKQLHSYIVAIVPNRADADDILQETSAVLWRKFAQYEAGTHFGAWACRIAYFEILAFRRRNRVNALRLSDSCVELVSGHIVERSEELEARHRALVECLTKLRPTHRDLIAMRYGGGVTIKEVAEKIGRSVEGLYKTFRHIHRTLFECVDRTMAREEGQ